MTTSIYTVYKTTNTTNDKIYIGVHKTTDPNDSYFGSGTAIKLAIKKYGKSNFVKEILFEYDNPKDALIKESQIVDEPFINNPMNYNIAIGGVGCMSNRNHTNKTKLKMSNSHKGNRLSQKTRKKISKFHQGKIISKETRKKISISNSGKNNYRFKGHYITPFGKFNTLANPTIPERTLLNWCKNPNKIINIHSTKQSNYLQSLKESPLGKTFREIGFYFDPI